MTPWLALPLALIIGGGLTYAFWWVFDSGDEEGPKGFDPYED
jgi:nitrogen fixation-related uncharacterized protein